MFTIFKPKLFGCGINQWKRTGIVLFLILLAVMAVKANAPKVETENE